MRISDWSSDVCSSDLAQAEFDVRIPADEDPARGRSIGTPWLGYAIGDVRGLRGKPRLRVDGRDVPVLQGLDEEGGDGLHAKLPAPRARSEERPAGKGGGRTGESRWGPDH